MKGAFITFEGCEGVGKTTQLQFIKEYLSATGQDAVFTREPGGCNVAEAIRGILLNKDLNVSPKVEAYLFAVARIDHIDNVIVPALKAGKIVICDRYIDSSFAYQGKARKLGLEYVKKVNEYAVNNCMPDCTIFLDLAPEKSWRRQNGTSSPDDRFEREKLDFHKQCYLGFLEIADIDRDRIVRIVPDIDKNKTSQKIIEVLKNRSLIK